MIFEYLSKKSTQTLDNSYNSNYPGARQVLSADVSEYLNV